MIRCVRPIRHCSSSALRDCSTYLAECRSKGTDINSTVFRGTLYECVSKGILEHHLKCRNLQRTGGAYDQGIDLAGKWDLGYFFGLNEAVLAKIEPAKMIKSNSFVPVVKNSLEYRHLIDSPVTSTTISLANDINTIVQCKNFSSRISGATVRELIGIYLHNVKPSKTKTTFMFLVSPAPLTKQAYGILNKAAMPLIHVTLSPLTLVQDPKDLYDIKSWTGGIISSVYMNSASTSLLRFLNLELQLNRLKNISVDTTTT